MICGDFNVTFSLDDNNKRTPNLGDLLDAQNFLEDLNLVDPPLHGRGFTWTNRQVDQIWVRLDYFLLLQNWSTVFPRTCQYSLPRFGSDYTPICLEFGSQPLRSKTFCFEKSWYSDESLSSLMHDWWFEINPEGCGTFILSKRLNNLKAKLHKWASDSFGSIKAHKNFLLLELNYLDSTSETRSPLFRRMPSKFSA